MAQTPYNAPSVLRRGGLDLEPSNPFGLPGSTGGLPRGSDSLYLSSGIFGALLGPIPNLQVGYLYRFGSRYSRQSRLTLDYLLPVSLGSSSAAFGEAHGEFTNFPDSISSLVGPTSTSGFNQRTDLSFGGGYRRIFKDTTLVGVNGFYDAAKLGGRWYSSGGLGVEMAFLMPGNGALDLTANWYDNLFHANAIRDVFRRGPGSFDVQAGYSQELCAGGPDLRIHATGYRFRAPGGAYGWKAGAELKSRDGMFSVKYEAGQDQLHDTYHTVGAFVNVGFDLAALSQGRNPFTMPEAIFRSPRNLSHLLSRPVKRDYITRALTRTQGAAGPDCLSQLPGSVVTETTLEKGTVYPTDPPIPALPNIAIQVTICWCQALSNYTNVQFEIDHDGDTGNHRTSPFTNTQGDGCTQVQADFAPNSGGFLGIRPFGGAAPPVINFGPGGGISFAFP